MVKVKVERECLSAGTGGRYKRVKRYVRTGEGGGAERLEELRRIGETVSGVADTVKAALFESKGYSQSKERGRSVGEELS